MVDQHQLVNRATSSYLESNNVTIVPDKAEIRFAPLRSERRYFNDTGDDVTVIERSGIPFTIAPSGRNNPAVRIQVIYEYDINVTIDPKHDFLETPADTPEIKAWQQYIKNVRMVRPAHGRTTILCIEYIFSIQELRNAGGSVYVAELDLVINVGPAVRNMPLHPYSHSDVRKDLVHGDCDVNHRDRFGLSMYIVSNTESHPGRYINVAGHVYHIPAIMNYSMKEGVYFSAKSNKDTNKRQAEPDTEFTSIEEADAKFGLYKTREEASQHGHSDSKIELELSKTKHELKVLEQQHKERNLILEAKQNELKRAAEQEEYYRQLQSQQRKDFYEERSYHRKDTSESIKMVPILLTGLAAIGGLVWKLAK